jgi:hypothetical protein
LPVLRAGHSQVAVHWIGVLGNIWPSMEFSIYASAKQPQLQNPDWFKDDSDLEPRVEVFARSPTAESYSVTMLNRSDNALFGETPDSEWRTTSWHDFEEFTSLVCGSQGYSSHSRNSIPRQFQRRQFKCSVAGCKFGFDTSKAFSVICPATWLENLILAGFRGVGAASRVAITSKLIMPRMENRGAAIATWLPLIGLALHATLVSADSRRPVAFWSERQTWDCPIFELSLP